ncbi:hypothetical protein CHM34_02715 [Paludifilum halophilum]|uniref:DUF2935 domain-containing protein n=2 Tax=Paludifilum halophilum TaxID=1642702 RepID=A0A235BC91_9BACL|nr:DUF2935 domain-containing protein [Paludifilum halophilum]OYD09904.1 hypothetical protein CHM34_02715 [Paludifilum halophilum]
MQFYYGEQQPLRILDEEEFWKQQEAEHTVVIREVVEGLEEKYIKILKEWERAFYQTRERVVSYIETVIRSTGRISPELYQEIFSLTYFCYDQSTRFIAFLNELMENSEPIRSNLIAQVVMRHIIRESEYFVGIARTVLYSRQ